VDLNVYVVEVLARQRLEELRAMRSAHRAAATASRPFRVTAGLALQRLGVWVSGEARLPQPVPR
jgi:hypothetical protein